MGATPVSDAGCGEQCHCSCISAVSIFIFNFPICADSAPTRADSHRIDLYRSKPPKQIDSGCTDAEPADSSQNLKKRKKKEKKSAKHTIST